MSVSGEIIRRQIQHLFVDETIMPLKRDAETLLIRRLGAALERAPWSTCRRVGSWFGLAFFHASRRRHSIATRNLRLVFPGMSEAEARQIARRSAQNFGMSFCEFLHLRTASEQEIRDYCEFDGIEHLQSALEQGRGVILPTAHFGAWEVMGARIALDFPMTVVVRLTSNEALKSHIKEVRSAVGLEMILKNETGRESMRVLRRNEILALFPDQHAGKRGVLMPFFGHPTSVFTSPARLAITSNAPLVAAFGVRRSPWLSDGRVTVQVSPPLSLSRGESRDESVMQGTQQILGEVERIVRAHPDQWLWMHRRWRKGDLKKLAELNADESSDIERSPQ
jgi:KDO2-lipid IV(A) lauroyltransferase